MGSGQGVGVRLAMARVSWNLEHRSWLGNAAWAGGEDETGLAVSRSEVSFPSRFNCTCSYIWILML